MADLVWPIVFLDSPRPHRIPWEYVVYLPIHVPSNIYLKMWVNISIIHGSKCGFHGPKKIKEMAMSSATFVPVGVP